MGKKGLKPHNWNGGISMGRHDGYIDIFLPFHPRSHGHGYVFEHTLIAEKALGKELPANSVIHHHTSEQIIICQDQAYHNLLHKRTRAYINCGHASWWKCVYCKEYDSLKKLVVHSRGSYIHTECRKERLKKYRKDRRRKVDKRTKLHPST